MRETGKSRQTTSSYGVAKKGFNNGGETSENASLISRFSLVRLPLQWLAIAVGLIVVFALFVTYDYARLMENAEARLKLSAQFLAAELADADVVSAPVLLGFLVRQVPQGSDIYLTGEDGGLVAATGEVTIGGAFTQDSIVDALSASAPISGSLGTAIVSFERDVVLKPMWQHAAVAAGLVFLLLVLAWRRHDGPPSEPAQRTTGKPYAMMDILPFGVAHWSGKGELIACNDYYRAFLGLGAADTKPGSAYVRTMNKVTSMNGCHLVSEEDAVRLTEITRRDGTLLLMDERPLSEGGFITLVSDISAQRHAVQELEDVRREQREMAQQLREEKLRAESASRAKTSFLAHLSHDVRTPLNHIIGFADLIAHQTYGPVGDKRYLNYINDIKGAGEKLLMSFSEILELAQLEGGHLVLRREKFEIAEIINSIANRFQDNAQRAGVTLDISLPEAAELYADRLCVERMLGNIVENAIQFTPSGGHIKLAAWMADDGVVLEVSDTGIGISGDRLKDLTQPFVLGDAAFTRESNGVGLGIAIARSIAELSGGTLVIDSSPAVGTTVAISLPKRTAKPDRVAHAA